MAEPDDTAEAAQPGGKAPAATRRGHEATVMRQPSRLLVAYVVLATLVAGALLYHLFVITPDLRPGLRADAAPVTAATRTAAGTAVMHTDTVGAAVPWRDQEVFLLTAGIMLCCGVLGGCLYDIRGLVKHSAENDFDNRFELSYYLRPFAGALSGLIVFFLLLGGALAFNITPGNGDQAMAWKTFAGRMPYITFGLLAGYASHAFMMKLKEVADSVFSTRGAGGRPPAPPSARRTRDK